MRKSILEIFLLSIILIENFGHFKNFFIIIRNKFNTQILIQIKEFSKHQQNIKKKLIAFVINILILVQNNAEQ